MMSPTADRQLQTQGMGAALVKGKSSWGNIFILNLFSEGQLLGGTPTYKKDKPSLGAVIGGG